MFRFVYKMFSEGHASIPQAGMEAIPEQLAQQLAQTKVEAQKEVTEIRAQEVHLADGTTLKGDAVLLATSMDQQHTDWHSCTNLYFEIDESNLPKQAIIGLIAEPNCWVNNFHVVNHILDKPDQTPVLSVTVIRDWSGSAEKLEEQIREEMKSICQIELGTCIQTYQIPKALPLVADLQYQPGKSISDDGIFRAGDYLANASLNAAMESGKIAAEEIISQLS